MSEGAPYSCPGCDLTGHSFAGADLTNANLKGAKLDGAIFTGATGLAGCDVTGASLHGTDFSGCDVGAMIFGPSPKFGIDAQQHRTTFTKSTVPYSVLGDDWSNIDLTEAVITNWPGALSKLQATNAVLQRLVFGVHDFTNVHFYGCDLTGADFSGATLSNAVFISQCNLTSAKFCGATMLYAVLDTSTLTRTDFTGAKLGGASLLQTRMNGTIFDGIDLTGVTFSQPPRFSNDPAFITSLRGATIHFTTIGKQWSYFDLTNANIVGLDASVDLTWITAKYTVFGPMKLNGYVLNSGDFTGAKFAGTDFSGAKLISAVFDNSIGTPVTTPVKKPSVIFDNATLTNASFHDAVLPSASFIQSLLHGATMTNMNLSGANLTGAQMGSQALLFTVADPQKYAEFLKALQNANLSVIVRVFVDNAVQVTHITLAAASPVQPITVWVVTDTDTQIQYTARDLTISNQKFISVFNNNAPHADLGDTYMPAAVLTQANLYGVFASGIHLYGAGTKLDNAILESVDFSKSNLGTANFSRAVLNDAIFDDAILTGAMFQDASLVPGQSGRGVSFQRANLQGTKFSTAKLYGANLQDAAMAVSYGVWIGSVAANDGLYATYVNELKQSVNLFTMDPKFETQLSSTLNAAFKTAFSAATKKKYTLGADATVAITQYAQSYSIVDGTTKYQIVPGIDGGGTAAWQIIPSASTPKPFYVPLSDQQYFVPGPVSEKLRGDFQTKGKVTLTSNAAVSAGTRAVLWQITDGANLFALWEGFDERSERVIYFRPSMPNVTQLFAKFQMTIPRASVTASGSVWALDNDSNNPFGTTLGYVTFNIVQAPNSGPLDIYGSTMRIERLAAPNQLQYYSIVCDATQISADNFDPQTVWPNGSKQPSITGGTIKPEWLHARVPPRPPICVPNEYSYCPAPPTSSWTRMAGDDVKPGTE